MRIVVVGDIATDVVARFSGPLHLGSDSTAVIATYGGGSAANLAAWLAYSSSASRSSPASSSSSRIETVFVGRAGNDSAGAAQIAELTAAGVQVRVAIDADRATGCVVVLVNAQGERTMLPDRGASAALSLDDLPADVFTAGDHLHLSGYPLLHASSRAAARAALQRAVAAGMTTSIDPSSRAPLEAVGASQFLEWTSGVDLCVANLDEAQVLAGPGTPADVARRLASSAYREVVVKLGADGALWSDGEAVQSVPATAATVMDTTGAGDAFAAGFLSVCVVHGAPLAALSAGSRLAAVAVGTPGGRPPR